MSKSTPGRRLAVLEAAEKGGNVAAACRQHGMDRATFYKLSGRVEGLPREQWLAALEDLPRKWKSHGQQTTKAQRKKILDISLQNPAWGCQRISEWLAERGIERSANTVQKILISEGLGRRADRARRLDLADSILNQAQKEIVREFNPSYKERSRRGKKPGEFLHVGTIDLGKLPNLGELVLFVGVDTYSSYAFGAIRRKSTPGIAEKVLEDWMLPEMKRRVGSQIGIVLSPRRPEYDRNYGAILRDEPGFEKHLRRAAEGRMSGFIERFANVVLEDFMSNDATKDVYDSIGQLKRDFKTWRAGYNERPIHGFPNYGESPIDMIGNGWQA